MTELLRVENLDGYYGSAHVLQGVSFTMGAEPVALIGRNGMGKTTLCKAIVGLLGSASGAVRLEGQELLGRPPYKIAGARLRPVPAARGTKERVGHVALGRRAADARDRRGTAHEPAGADHGRAE